MAVMVAVLSVLSIVWGLKLLNVIWWRPKMIEKKLRNQGIRGHPYKLIHGNTKEMIKLAKEKSSETSPQNPHDILPSVNPLLHDLVTTYKKSFVIWYGTTPRVAIMEPNLIKEVLNNKSGEFLKPEINSFSKLFVTGLASYNGDKWAKHRKIVNPAFHIEKLKHMLPAFAFCVEEMISKWDKLVKFMGSCEVDMSVEFQNLTGDVISRAAFGSNFKEGRLIFLLQKEQGRLFLESQMSINFPLLRLLPNKVNKRMRHIHKEVRTLLRGIIQKRDKAISTGHHEDDLLGLLLKSNLNEQEENKDSEHAGMTMEDVIEECKLFYFAGQETTANLLTWTMIVLSMHKEWQEQAREEVLKVFENNKPAYNDLNRLKIINMILLEVLRLYPSTSLIRCTNKETQLGNLSLPAGVQLFMPLHLIHRDTEQWGEDAMEFKPERFSEGIFKATEEISYFPFGWGPRVCVGQSFAMLESKLAMAKILQNFAFELSPTYKHAPFAAVTLQPRYGAQIILHKLGGEATAN